MNISNSFTLVEFLPDPVVEEFSLKTKVCVGLTAPILLFLIIFLNFGIAYYEKFGNDPQKRNLYNMMISSLCMGMATGMSFWVVLPSIRIIWEPFDVSNVFALSVTITFFQVFNGLCLLEAIFYRVLAVYHPKAIIGLNDDFFHNFFNYWNIMIALIYSLTSKWNMTPLSSPLKNLEYLNGYFLRLLIGQKEQYEVEK